MGGTMTYTSVQKWWDRQYTILSWGGGANLFDY